MRKNKNETENEERKAWAAGVRSGKAGKVGSRPAACPREPRRCIVSLSREGTKEKGKEKTLEPKVEHAR